jgi:hypothetical protein
MPLGNMRANGVWSLDVSCWQCHHRAILSADMWARLLAAAADPARAGLVRLAFVAIRKEDGPFGHTCSSRAINAGAQSAGSMVANMTSKFRVAQDDVIVSCLNLEELV